MTWLWRYEDAQGGIVDDPAAEPFPSRGDAESWLGEHWPSIAAAGVRRAQLLNGMKPVGRAIALPDAGDAPTDQP